MSTSERTRPDPSGAGCHIREAVRASVLSKRWRHLGCQTSGLFLDASYVPPRDRVGDSENAMHPPLPPPPHFPFSPLFSSRGGLAKSSPAPSFVMSFTGAPGGAASAAAPQQYFCRQCNRTVTLTTSPGAKIPCPICHGGYLEEFDLPDPNPHSFFSFQSSDPFFLSPSPFSFLFSPSSSRSASFDLRNPSDLAGFFRLRRLPRSFNLLVFLDGHIQQLLFGGANIQIVLGAAPASAATSATTSSAPASSNSSSSSPRTTTPTAMAHHRRPSLPLPPCRTSGNSSLPSSQLPRLQALQPLQPPTRPPRYHLSRRFLSAARTHLAQPSQEARYLPPPLPASTINCSSINLERRRILKKEQKEKRENLDIPRLQSNETVR